MSSTSASRHHHSSARPQSNNTSSKPSSGSSSRTPYSEALTAVIAKANAIPKHKDPVWAKTIALATESDPRIALSKSSEVERWLKSVFAKAPSSDKAAQRVKIAARTQPKVWSRVQAKLHPTNGNDPLEGAYRAQTDWIAFRIRCGRQEDLLHIFDVISQAATKIGGTMDYRLTEFERRLRTVPKISSNCDLFLPHIGYFVEIQIGTDVAFHMWCRDSYLRANPNMKPYLPNYAYSPHQFQQVVEEAVVGKYGTVDKPLQQLFREFEAKNYKYLKQADWMKERNEILAILRPVLSDKAIKSPHAVFPVSSVLKNEWQMKEGGR